MQLALKGEPFSYHGRHLSVPREVVLRPTPRMDNVTFHGAIGAPSSALKIAELGLPPMLTAHSPLAQQQKVLDSWTTEATRLGLDPDSIKLASPILVMADTDEEAAALARKHVPAWYQLQVEHYAFDAERYADVPHYQSFTEVHKRRLVYCDPANLDPLIEYSLIGSAETVRAKLKRFFDIGYNYVLVVPSLPGLPHALRQDWLTRFARDVMPHFAEDAAAA
jgi:alkanesulfonate monooxygenase SsuD/methylene tetrahydromethanopterin reductase-like flavin-dependent oxidoreductase (luciferase family)